jgi:predicted dehydrogenase
MSTRKLRSTPAAPPAASVPLRIGVLGCAHIARQFCRDLAGSPAARVDAVASRDAGRAAAFAAAFGIPRHSGSYEALLVDPALDAIYIPLPNSLHAAWAVRSLEHGKHVLCEKPLATSLAQARQMFETARRHDRFLLEAYPYWFQPETGALLQLLGEGAIGEVRWMQACAAFTLRSRADDIRLRPELGGGALLDIGSYPLSLVRLVMGCAPRRVSAEATWTETGVDLSFAATLHFADGRRAQVSGAMDAGYVRRGVIAGSRGTIECEFLNHTAEPGRAHPWGYQPSALRVRRGPGNDVPWELLRSPAGSGFRFAAEAFARVVKASDRAAIERAARASLDLAATMEAVLRSAREGAPVDVVV